MGRGPQAHDLGTQLDGPVIAVAGDVVQGGDDGQGLAPWRVERLGHSASGAAGQATRAERPLSGQKVEMLLAVRLLRLSRTVRLAIDALRS